MCANITAMPAPLRIAAIAAPAQQPGRAARFPAEPRASVNSKNPAIGRPWRGFCARYTEKASIRARDSDEQTRNHDHHSGDEESQAREQQKVAQEYRHTPASPYLPPVPGDHDISSDCPWFDA